MDSCTAGVAREVWESTSEKLRRTPEDAIKQLFKAKRTLLVAYGDSTMKQQRRSMNCMLQSGGAQLVRTNEVTPVGLAWVWSLGGKDLTVVPSLWAEKFPEITRPHFEELLATQGSSYDRIVMVVGLGSHYNTNDMDAYAKDLTSFVQWSEQLASDRREKLRVVLREPPPQHFDGLAGRPAGQCRAGDLLVTHSRLAIFKERVRTSSLGSSTLDIQNDSLPLWFAHSDPVMKPNDCTHFCAAVPYLWNVALTNLVASM